VSFIEWKFFFNALKTLICKKQGKCGRYSDATPAYCVITRDSVCIQFSLEHKWEQYCYSLVKTDITKFYGRKKISESVLINTLIAIMIFVYRFISFCVPGSSVGIATDYGLDSLGTNPCGDEIFCPSRPALGPTQAPVQWVLGLSRG